MFVKLNESIINLDLVKEISEVVAYVEGDDEPENYYYEISDPAEIAHWLTKTAKEGSSYRVRFGFRIHYLEEKFPKHVKVSQHRHEAAVAREELATLLNGNQPVIHEIRF
jgi:hypothetical protein